MAKLKDTIINGDLYLNSSSVKSNGEDVIFDTNFKGPTNEYYYIPLVLWHGRIWIQPTPLYFGYSSQDDFNVNGITFVSTGIVTITFTGASAPQFISDYQVITIGDGRDTNSSTLSSYITVTNKLKNSFTLKLADDTSTNNGYCEIMIMTFRYFNKFNVYG